jgi:hypothetical protein
MLARDRLLPAKGTPDALMVSNPGGGLPLLETISRATARELANGGYRTTALFGDDVKQETVREQLPRQTVFIWEGHHETLAKTYGLPGWPKRLRPSLMFLQSCLALSEADAYPLMERGAVAVVGSSTRIYSGTGGAFTLAYFDALLYDDQSLGGALRQGKNFLLAYALLKEERLGEDSKLEGANLRSAWAFTLWGDPAVRLPRPERPADALPPVRRAVRGKTITLTVPAKTYDRAAAGDFRARVWPNARVAGLVRKDDDGKRDLVPLVFAEVPLPQAPDGKDVTLTSKLLDRRWVWLWDARRKVGSLLVVPPDDRRELRFQAEWAD